MAEEKPIRIQDDLYHYVNGKWLETAVIPDDKPTAGGFADLDTGVEKLLMADFAAMAKGEKKIPDKYVAKAILLYKKALDTKRRNEEGLKPVLPLLVKIDSLQGIDDFNKNIKELVLGDYPLPVQFGVDTDMKNTKAHCFLLVGPSTILPDTTYYAEGNKQGAALLNIWSQMAQKLLAFSPLSPKDQEQYLKDTLAFDKKISGIVKSQEEWADYVKCYNPQKTEKVIAALSPLDLRGLLQGLYGKLPSKVIVYDPRFLKNFQSLYNADTFALYKHWAYVKALVSSCGYLSESLRTLGNTYRRTLIGLATDSSIEKQAFHNADDAFSEPVGLYYGKTYFGEEAKKDVVDMVKSIIEMYKKRMAKNRFLAAATKEKAILKLSTMEIKMGYPDKIQPLYDTLTVEEGTSFYAAMEEIDREKSVYAFSKLFEPVDRTLWVMPGDMVNACYNPYSNDITFPSAILQAPFYSLKQSRSANLGGIGAVIGHEISHAFDNNGAQCDENGNLKNWWTKEDFKKFKALTKNMVKEFDGIAFAGSKVNGKLVVSENIADNGGMAVTLALVKELKDPNYNDYFESWARIWCQKAREQYQQLLLSVDVHSPTELRANMQPRNFPEWYATYKVTKKDQMYLAPSKRVTIW
jgi:putative endopeptidase